MATQFAVDLVFKANGADRELRKLQGDTSKLADAAKKAQGSLKGAENNIRSTGRAAATATGNVQRLGVAFRTTFAPLTAIIGTITLLSKSLNTMASRDADLRTLANGLRDLTDNSQNAARALEQQADALGKATLFDQEDFTAAFKLFTSFKTIGVDSYGRVAEAAADMAQVLGQGPKDAALQLAKALEAPDVGLTALQRSGTRFSESQKEVIKGLVKSGQLFEAQDLILKEIEKQYGGAAKAAGQQGFAGAMDTLGETFRDFQEGLGRIAEPLLVPFVNGLTAIFEAATRVQPAFQAFLGSLGKIAGAMTPVINALGLGELSLIGLADAFAFAYKVAAVVANDIAYVVGELANKVAGVINGVANGIADFFGQVLPNNSASGMAALVKNFAEGIRQIRNLWAGLVNTVPAFALAKLFGVDVGQILTGPIGAIADGIEGAFQYGASVISRASAMDFGGNTSFNTRRPSFTPEPDGGGGGKGGKGGGGKGGKGGADKAAREAQREAELTARQLKAAQDRLFAAEQLLAKQQELNQVQEIELKRDQEIASVQREYSDLISKVKSIEEENALIQARGLEIDAAKLKAEKAIQELRESALASIDEEIALQQAKLAGKEEEYQIQKRINDLVKQGGGTITRAQAASKINELQQLTKLTEAQDKAKASAEALAGSISSALTDSLRGLIDGSMSAEEALSNAFKKIGDAFLDMAMQMIQEWIKMKLIGLVGSMFGGSAGAAGVNPQGAYNIGLGSTFEGGGYTGSAPRTGGIDGKGGFPAILHPQETVIDHTDINSSMGRYGSGGNGAPMLNMSFQTTQFMDREWVDKEQLMAAMQATQQRSVAQSQAKTFSTLRNSRSQRARLGMS